MIFHRSHRRSTSSRPTPPTRAQLFQRDCRSGHLPDIIRRYDQQELSGGCPINARYLNGETPCGLAARCGREPTLTFLIDQGADPNLADYAGRTPLTWAIRNNNITMVNLLLNHEAAIVPSHREAARDKEEIEAAFLRRDSELTYWGLTGREPPVIQRDSLCVNATFCASTIVYVIFALLLIPCLLWAIPTIKRTRNKAVDTCFVSSIQTKSRRCQRIKKQGGPYTSKTKIFTVLLNGTKQKISRPALACNRGKKPDWWDYKSKRNYTCYYYRDDFPDSLTFDPPAGPTLEGGRILVGTLVGIPLAITTPIVLASCYWATLTCAARPSPESKARKVRALAMRKEGEGWSFDRHQAAPHRFQLTAGVWLAAMWMAGRRPPDGIVFVVLNYIPWDSRWFLPQSPLRLGAIPKPLPVDPDAVEINVLT